MFVPVCRVLFAIALAVPLPAAAHAILIDSVPPIHASIPPGKVALTLHYNSRIDRQRSRLTLIAPDKSETRLAVGPDGPADVINTTAEMTPGDYVVRWQVLATDGHITRGDLPLSVQAP